MGGYGGYVWTAYAITFGVVVICVAQGRRRHRKVLEDLRSRLRAAPERSK
jgi:heme exporter protein CcmD